MKCGSEVDRANSTAQVEKLLEAIDSAGSTSEIPKAFAVYPYLKAICRGHEKWAVAKQLLLRLSVTCKIDCGLSRSQTLGDPMSKLVYVDETEGACRIFNGDRFSGTAVVYAATPDDHTSFQCDFELDTLCETRPEEVRSQRILRKRAGVALPAIREDQLAKELIIILGPEVSANDAVAALERLASLIRKNGMLIGRDDQDDFAVETFEPSQKRVR